MIGDVKSKASAKKTRSATVRAEADFVAISATVPREVVAEARSRYAKRNFSEFVARAMARELVREGQTAYVAAAELERPMDEALYETFSKLLRV
jgi:hypothetical protein